MTTILPCDSIQYVATLISNFYVKLEDMKEEKNECDKMIKLLFEEVLVGLYGGSEIIKKLKKIVCNKQIIIILIVILRDRINRLYFNSGCKGTLLWDENLGNQPLYNKLIEIYSNEIIKSHSNKLINKLGNEISNKLIELLNELPPLTLDIIQEIYKHKKINYYYYY